MKTEIKSLEQFREEKQRVVLRLMRLENLIKEDIGSIKQDLKPWKLAGNTLKSLLISEHDGVVGETIGLTVNGLIKNVILRKSGWITKFIVAYVLKNYTKN